MRALLAGGANADVLDKYDWTPLHWTVRLGGESGATRARLLLDGGADVNMRGVNPELSPLDYADQRGQAAVAAVLRGAGGLCFVRTGGLCDAPVVISEDVATIVATVSATVVATVAATVAVDDGASCPAGSLPANGMTQAQLDQAMLDALRSRYEVEEVCEYLRRGANVNAYSTGQFRGRYAKKYVGAPGLVLVGESVETAKLLLANGADVNRRGPGPDGTGWPPLMYTGWVSLEVVRLYLSYGADPNLGLRDVPSWTPLHEAASRYHDNWPFMKALLDGGADPNIQTTRPGGRGGGAPLHYVFDGARYGWARGVSVLVAGDADVNARDGGGHSALDLAVIGGDAASAEILRAAGGQCFVRTGGLCDAPVVISEDVATIVATVSATVAATIVATVAEDVATVFATVAVTVAAGDGSSCPAGSLPANGLAQIRWNTTLMFSAMLRRLQPACDALRRGAYINVRDKEGRRPLYWAANHGDDAMVSLLIENGADVDVTKNGGVTPLHAAAKRNASVVVKLLIDGGADVNLKDSTGKTPLHWSASRKSAAFPRIADFPSHTDGVAAAKLLIDGGADVNATDNDGGTPLHTAAGSYVPGYVLVNPLALVRLLLANGADAAVTNNDGETALDIARRLGNANMVAILAPDENPSAPAPAEGEALADALRKDFAASFNPSPAFGDAFGAVSGSSESIPDAFEFADARDFGDRRRFVGFVFGLADGK